VVPFAADDDLAVAAGVEQAGQPGEVGLVDDPGVVPRHARIRAVEAADGLRQRPQQRRLDGAVDEHVVRGHARLAGVQELGPREASCRHLQVGVGGHDGRALASELERDRREVLGRVRRPTGGSRGK
jgi:hypothetical protein